MLYEENKIQVAKDIKEGRLDYQDLADWTLQDRLFAFLLEIRFFEICGASYPSPRRKEEVPVWFLLACKVQMKMNTTASFNRLPGILRSGAVLSRLKFNIGGCNGGFNNKNKKERESVIDHDTARKFFKDTDRDKLRDWHNQDVQRFIKANEGFDPSGIFILDQTHVVVPDNKNYQEAVMMPVDEHGQLIDTSKMSPEQKKAIKYRPCYTLSGLLHITNPADNKWEPSFSFAGYKWGQGNADELKQGKDVVTDFVKVVGKGVLKTLIVDRGYISGEFISYVKKELGSEVLMPLRKNMDAFTDPINIAKTYKYQWKLYDTYEKHGITYKEEVTVVKDVDIWEKCEIPLYVSLMRITGSDDSVRYWGLSSTFEPKDSTEAFRIYDLRTQIEERHRQIKNYWHLNEFSSPNRSLIEAHVLFTLLTYSLLQLYLNNVHLNKLANKTIKKLREEELAGKNNVIAYSGKYFGVFDLDEYIEIWIFLKEEARLKLQKWLIEFKKREKG